MKSVCKKPHRYHHDFERLADFQGEEGRHKCAGCAFELGVWHAMINVAQARDASVLSDLPESQAGAVRHKDAFEAYQNGYKHGETMMLDKAA